MKCLVINLDRSGDRLAHVAAEFGRIGVAFERVAAIDGRDRPEFAEIPMRANLVMQGRLTNTEIGCLLSHRACWDIIAHGNDAYGAIFEDDTVFSSNAGTLLADISWIPADADIVKLETVFHPVLIDRQYVTVGHGFSASRLLGIHYGSGGYIVSKRAARDFFDGTREIGVPVDHVLFDPVCETSASKTIYQLVPALCAQDQFMGDIATQLPSVLDGERPSRTGIKAPVAKRKRSLAEKIIREACRPWLRMLNRLRPNPAKIIPFYLSGKRVRPPHTQR